MAIVESPKLCGCRKSNSLSISENAQFETGMMKRHTVTHLLHPIIYIQWSLHSSSRPLSKAMWSGFRLWSSSGLFPSSYMIWEAKRERQMEEFSTHWFTIPIAAKVGAGSKPRSYESGARNFFCVSYVGRRGSSTSASFTAFLGTLTGSWKWSGQGL